MKRKPPRARRLAMFLLACGLAGGAGDALDIGARRELFLDRFLIERLAGAELRLAQPIDAGTVLPLDRPWEGMFSNYFTVIQDGALYRLYYRGLPVAAHATPAEVTCYAESRDGIHWVKPELGLHEVQGTANNNIIIAHDPPFSENFSPFLDTCPGAAPGERFKALAGNRRVGLWAFTSSDGIRWRKLRSHAVLPPSPQSALDSQNVSFWSEHEKAYLCYFRTFRRVGGVAYRWVSRTTSPDFVNWSEPVEMSCGDTPTEHLYTSQTGPYFRAPHLYVGIAARFMQGRQALSAEQAKAIGVDPKYFGDCSDLVLLVSRGGDRYDRTFLESFLRPGLGWENWVSRSNYSALNVVQTGPTEMSFYVARDYAQRTAHLQRYALRLDGFASVHAPYAGGEMITRPLRFRGSKLVINYATSAAGGLRVEIQQENGAPVPGYSLAEATEMIGDEIDGVVRWKGTSDVSRLAGQAVRLRFVMKDADLYALQFQP